MENVRNFKISKDITFPRTNVEKIAANLEAISLVKKLEHSGKQATKAEQAILARYVGWGGISNDFFTLSRYETERKQLQALVSKDEYKSLEASSLTAYYTDPMIASEMWKTLLNNGFKGGNILDPAMGTGIFFATMPEEIRANSTLFGIELDTITGAIAKQLFPEANIKIQDFETIEFHGTPFDLVITNVPFSDIRIYDKKYGDKSYLIHDYFIRKSFDVIQNKGIVSVITSTGTVDKRQSILSEIQELSAFLGGVRLPNNAFKKIAGTDVTTDILYFQKDLDHICMSDDKIYSPAVRSTLDNEGRIFINPYFLKEKDIRNSQVLGDYAIKHFNGATLTLAPEKNTSLQLQLHNALNNVSPLSKFESNRQEIVIADNDLSKSEILNGLKIRLNEYACDDLGNIYYRDSNGIQQSTRSAEITFYQNSNKKIVNWEKDEKAVNEFRDSYHKNPNIVTDKYISDTPVIKGDKKGLYKGTIFYEKELRKSEKERICGMIAIKNVYQKIIDIQSTSLFSNDEFEQLLKLLNKTYDSFVEKYGYINSRVNSSLFERDDRYPLIASLEEEVLDENDSTKIVYKKSEAFTKPLIRPKKTYKKVSTAIEALNISLSEKGDVDLNFMLSIYPCSEEQLVEELDDKIMVNINKYYLTNVVAYSVKEAVLSGDVLTKKKMVEKLLEKGDTAADWKKYLKNLDQVLPEPILISEINYNLGSVWIPENVIGMFVYQTFGGENDVQLDSILANQVISTTPLGRTLKGDFVRKIRYRATNLRLGLNSGRYSEGHEILLYLLNSDKPNIMKNIGTSEKPKRVIDEVETANLREAERKIENLFKNFVEEHDDVKRAIENAYNNKFNSYVPRKYNGEHLVIDGLIKTAKLRTHQLNAVQRIIEDKRALLAHEVGTGKTLTMISAGFKMKDLGLIHKPLYVVPSSLTAQFGQEIMRFYPTRKVFVTTERDFEKSRRKLFISRVVSHDYDAIVIGHSQFEKIKVSQKEQCNFIQDKIAKLEEIIEYAKKNNDRITFKKAQSMEIHLQKRLEKLTSNLNKRSDNFIDFKSLGIDMLFVDEAHKFKNIHPVTRLGNVVGISSTTAQKNIDMEMKIRSIQQEHNGTNVVFATGTPVSNSISEMYTMMNYIQPDILNKLEIGNFDAWVGAFGIIENSLELSPTGKYVSRKRFSKFTNLPELLKIYKITADIQMTKSLQLPVPVEKRIAIKSEMTSAQKEYLQELVERSENVKSGTVNPSEDNMLKITGEARKLAIDMRLLDDTIYSSKDSNKLQQVVENVVKIYKDEESNRGTQMIFSDIGTPSKKGFNLYQELKRLLVFGGISKNEIAFIHDAKNKKARLQLQRKVNAGEIRILIASTEKGGTGLNVQRRMKAVHHLDVPWKPSDFIQRNGRLIRQGNIYENVLVYYYITTGSFDNYLWQIQENKLKFITQIMTDKAPIRIADDIDEQTLTASEFKAIATGNPYIKLKIETDNEVQLLKKQKSAWISNYSISKRKFETAKERLLLSRNRLKRLKEDIKLSQQTQKKTSENKFSMFFPESGQLYTDKELAGNQLHYEMQNNVAVPQTMRTLAIYRGFKLRMTSLTSQYVSNKIIQLKIVGANQYSVDVDFSSPKITIRKINQVLDNLLTQAKKIEKSIMIDQITVNRGVTSANFPQQDRLNYILAKQKVISPLVENSADISEIEEALQKFESENYFTDDNTADANSYTDEELVEVELKKETKFIKKDIFQFLDEVDKLLIDFENFSCNKIVKPNNIITIFESV